MMEVKLDKEIDVADGKILPDERVFRTKRVVVKYGGNAMLDERSKGKVAKDIVQLKDMGMDPVVVHGGGPAVTSQMNKEGLEPEFVHGQRRTDEKTLKVAEMVLSGRINKDLVRHINENGGNAVGISGKDGLMVKARKLTKRTDIDGIIREVDLGRVGEVVDVDITIIDTLLRDGFIPVVSPICSGDDGGDLNVNADILAGEIASYLEADTLVYMTNVDGIHTEKGNPKTRIESLHVDDAEEMLHKEIRGGMIPKVESAIGAVRGGVDTVRIIDGTRESSLPKSFGRESDLGTRIHSKEEE